MDLDIACDDAPKRSYEIVDLTGIRTAHGVGNTNAVDADLIDSLVDREEIYEVGAEGVLGREADFDALRLDKVDDLDGSFGDVGHVLSVRKLAEEGRRSDDNVNAINTCFRGMG